MGSNGRSRRILRASDKTERALVNEIGATSYELFSRHYIEADERAWERREIRSRFSAYTARHHLIPHYGFAIPTVKAIDLVTGYSPILEVGAGTGYWAHLLKLRGADVQAFDPHPIYGNSHGLCQAWTTIARGNHRRAMRMYGERTLFICWPSLGDDWALECLQAHRGDYFIHIGEGESGCTANDEFFEYLEANYAEIDTYPIPQWPGIHDYLEVWQRCSK